MVPAQRGTCKRLDNSSSCSTVVCGCTKPPLFDKTQQVPTNMLFAIEFLNTSTPKVSAIISQVYLSRSGWIKATQSLQATQFPRAESFYSTLTTFIFSERLFLMFLSSLSVVLLGTISPFLFPAVVLPTILVPPIVVWITGINEPNQLSKTLQKLQDPPEATRQYPLVSLEKTPMSLEFQYCTLLAIQFFCQLQYKHNSLNTQTKNLTYFDQKQRNEININKQVFLINILLFHLLVKYFFFYLILIAFKIVQNAFSLFLILNFTLTYGTNIRLIIMDNIKEFDFIKNDRFYDLTIPSYYHQGQSVFYQISLKDLVQGKKYLSAYRFNELKLIHENLQKLKIELPQFPKTHLWKKTNKNPKMIQERRSVLEKYFSIVINDPFTRGCKDIKNFIRNCKTGNVGRRTYSLNTKKQQTKQRPKSLTRSNLSSTNQINLRMSKK